MKKRYFLWLFIVSIFAILFWQKRNLEEYIEDRLRSVVAENTSGSLLFNDVSIGAGVITIGEVRLLLYDGISNIHVQSMQLDYDPLQFFMNEFDPLAVVDNVAFTDGAITLYFNQERSDEITSENSADPFAGLFGIWDQYASGQQIELRNFSLNASFGEDGIYRLVEELDGSINVADSSLQLLVGGKLFQAQQRNTFLTGYLTRDTISLDLRWQEIALNTELPVTLPQSIGILSGRSFGAFHFRTPWQKLDDFRLRGDGEIAAAKLHYGGMEIAVDKLHFNAGPNGEMLLDGIGNLAKNPFALNGAVDLRNLGSSQLSVHLDWQDMSQVSQEFTLPEMDIRGKIYLEGLPFAENLPWQLDVDALAIRGRGLRIDSLSADASGDLQRLDLQQLRMRANGQTVAAGGQLNFSDGNAIVTAKVDGKTPTNAGPLSLKSLPYSVNATLHFSNFLLSKGNMALAVPQSGLSEQEFTLTNVRNHYLLRTGEDSSSLLSGEIDLWESLLRGEQMRGEFRLKRAFLRPFLENQEFLPEQILLSFDGHRRALTGEIIWQHGPGQQIMLSGDFQRTDKTDELWGLIAVQQGDWQSSGPFNYSHSASGLDFSLALGDFFSVDIHGPANADTLRGEMVLNEAPLHKLLSPWDRQLQEGYVSGRLNLGKNIDRNAVYGNLAFSRLLINGVGYYHSDLELIYLNDVLDIPRWYVALNNEEIIAANGYFDFPAEQYEFDFRGRKLDLEYLSETVFALPGQILGQGDIDFSLRKETAHLPQFTLSFAAQDGHAFGFPFAEISLRAENIERVEETAIRLNELRWQDSASSVLNVAGILPISEDSPMALTADFSGDLLKYVPLLEPFITEGRSQAEFSLRLGGTYQKPLIEEGTLTIDNGYLAMRDVIDEIEDIKVRMSKKPGTAYVDVQTISARIDDNHASIYSKRQAPPSSIALAPWYFKSMDINFGYFILETEAPGIPLKIFGPMRRGDSGRLHLLPAEGEEHFVFAGPPDAPRARGRARISDARVTYPFVTAGPPQEPTPVLRFLMTVDWDIRAVPIENVRYVNQVSAYIDDIIIEMLAEPTGSELYFDGRIADKSFRVSGDVVSRSGTLEYLDFDFRVEEFGVTFHPNSRQPEVYGTAVTTVRDSLGSLPRDIYLKLYSVDPKSGDERIGGEWSELRFKIVSDAGNVAQSEAEALAFLGYSGDNLRQKATAVGGAVTDNLIFRPLVRPLERNLEDALGLDIVRVNAVFTKNVLASSYNNGLAFTATGNDIYSGQMQGLALFNQSRFTLGKYVYPNLFLTYTGSFYSNYANTEYGLNHSFGVEYRLMRDLLFEVQYSIDPIDYRFYDVPVYENDFRFRVRHSIHF
jgi:hypothetical protein